MSPPRRRKRELGRSPQWDGCRGPGGSCLGAFYLPRRPAPEEPERILRRASDLWVQASLDYKQRLQTLFFPEGIGYDGNRFNRTARNGTTFPLPGAV